MHGPINLKSPNNISKWQMGFNSVFKGLNNLNHFAPIKSSVVICEHSIDHWVTTKRRSYRQARGMCASREDVGILSQIMCMIAGHVIGMIFKLLIRPAYVRITCNFAPLYRWISEGRRNNILQTPKALPIFSIHVKCIFSLLCREELAMKIGLTEARIQVSLVLNNYK
jgi:hypothetical protein